MNLSFAGCGFLGLYHLGVVSCIKKYAPKAFQSKVCNKILSYILYKFYLQGLWGLCWKFGCPGNFGGRYRYWGSRQWYFESVYWGKKRNVWPIFSLIWYQQTFAWMSPQQSARWCAQNCKFSNFYFWKYMKSKFCSTRLVADSIYHWPKFMMELILWPHISQANMKLLMYLEKFLIFIF